MRCKYAEHSDKQTKIDIYDLGINISEIYCEAEKRFHKSMIFFFAGDFMERSIK